MYDSNLPYKNGLVEVVPPGFTRPLVFRVQKNFTLILNSNLLKLNQASFSTLPELIDGVYRIKYSIDPNKEVNVEYYYFRNVKLINNYHLHLAELVKNKHRFTTKQYEERKKEMLWVAQMIKTSKYMAEELLDVRSAMELYNASYEKLKDIGKC